MEVVKRYAEILNMRMKLKVRDFDFVLGGVGFNCKPRTKLKVGSLMEHYILIRHRSLTWKLLQRRGLKVELPNAASSDSSSINIRNSNLSCDQVRGGWSEFSGLFNQIHTSSPVWASSTTPPPTPDPKTISSRTMRTSTFLQHQGAGSSSSSWREPGSCLREIAALPLGCEG